MPSFQIQVNDCLLSLHTTGCQDSVYTYSPQNTSALHINHVFNPCYICISVFNFFFRKNNATCYKTFLKGPLPVTKSTELMTKIVIYGRIIIEVSFFTTNEVHRSILICSPCLHHKCYR